MQLQKIFPLLLFSLFSCGSNLFAQNVVMNIEDFDHIELKDQHFGTHSFGLIYSGGLNYLLKYCMATTNQPVAKESIQLKEEKFLKVQVAARGFVDRVGVAQELLVALLNRYDLEIDYGTSPYQVIEFTEVQQDPLTALMKDGYPKLSEKRGGINDDEDGNIVFKRKSLNDISFFFADELPVETSPSLSSATRVSFILPQKLNEKLPRRPKKLQKLLASYGIQSRIVERPRRIIVPQSAE